MVFGYVWIGCCMMFACARITVGMAFACVWTWFGMVFTCTCGLLIFGFRVAFARVLLTFGMRSLCTSTLELLELCVIFASCVWLSLSCLCPRLQLLRTGEQVGRRDAAGKLQATNVTAFAAPGRK